MYTFTAGFVTTNSDKNVTLNSTLIFEEHSYPGFVVTFSCVTMGSASVTWLSDEYIGDDHVEFTSGDVGSSRVINSDIHVEAILVSANVIDNILILTSELSINVSSDYRNPSVSCLHVDGLSSETISFKVLTGTYLILV